MPMNGISFLPYDPYENSRAYATSGANPDAGAQRTDAIDASGFKSPDATEVTPSDKPGRTDPEKCETCAKRKYQDGSDENNVSFKNAAHLSPTAAGAAVRAHENMHVTNAYNKAKQADGKVLQAYVTIHTSICPECGRTYVSGGVTHTQIRYPNEANPYEKDKKAEEAEALSGSFADYSV